MEEGEEIETKKITNANPRAILLRNETMTKAFLENNSLMEEAYQIGQNAAGPKK